jgi:hypothetical protein
LEAFFLHIAGTKLLKDSKNTSYEEVNAK